MLLQIRLGCASSSLFCVHALSSLVPFFLQFSFILLFLSQRFSNVCPTKNYPSVFQDLNGFFWQSAVCLFCFSCHFYEEHVMKFLSLYLAPILLSCLLRQFSSCNITSSSSLFPHNNSKRAHYFILVWILPMSWRLDCKKSIYYFSAALSGVEYRPMFMNDAVLLILLLFKQI